VGVARQRGGEIVDERYRKYFYKKISKKHSRGKFPFRLVPVLISRHGTNQSVRYVQQAPGFREI
jgi:hypothetical protein